MNSVLTEIYGQLPFALSYSSVLCRSDTSTDSEQFYESILYFLDDLEEQDKVWFVELVELAGFPACTPNCRGIYILVVS